MNVLASSGQLRAGYVRWALVLVPLILLLGLLSGQLSGSGSDSAWFAALEKPAAYPPSAAFGIVWPLLYGIMGFALALVVAARGAPRRIAAILVFVLQLAMNLAWSPLFFGAHDLTGSLMLIAALDIAVIVTVVLFWKVRPVAGVLLLPYLAWILFATYLNWDIRAANPQLDGRDVPAPVQRFEF